MSRLPSQDSLQEGMDEQLEVDEITRQYQENQLILDRRALIAPFAITPFLPRSSHPMYDAISSTLSVGSGLLMLSAIVNPFRYDRGDKNIWLPVSVLSILNSFLFVCADPDAVSRFERLSESLFRPGITTEKSLTAYHGSGYLFQHSIADVIDAIVCGNFNKPERLLRANPGLLIQRGTATQPNGIVIENVTPLQAAILSGDMELFELIRTMLLSQPRGEAKFENQRLEIYARRLEAFCKQTHSEADRLQALLEIDVTNDTQFGTPITPKYIAQLRARCDDYKKAIDSRDFETIFKAHEVAKQNTARDLLDPIFKAINDATASEVTAALSTVEASWQETDEARVIPWVALTLTEKINRFRNTLKTSVPNAESLLQMAFEGRGHTNRFHWTNRELDKQGLCWRQVVGSIQACLPVRLVHAFSYSLLNIVEHRHQCPRSFKLRNDQSVSFYHSRLGFDFAICAMLGSATDMGWTPGGSALTLLSKFMSSSNSKFSERCHAASASRCPCPQA